MPSHSDDKQSTQEGSVSLVWFGSDLRVTDHPALQAAMDRQGVVIPVWIWSESEYGQWPPGAAKRWWMHHALVDLQTQLKKLGLNLVIQSGNSQEVLSRLIKQTGADAVYWNRRYEPSLIERDRSIKAWLKTQADLDVRSFNGSLLIEPWEIQNKTGGPYRVFTPFWKNASDVIASQLDLSEPKPIKHMSKQAQTQAQRLTSGLKNLAISDLCFEPNIPWDACMRTTWEVSEQAALKQLKAFDPDQKQYSKQRDFPSVDAVSRLSPYLANGQISPVTIYRTLSRQFKSASASKAAEIRGFIRQLGWREFAYHILYHFPQTPHCPLQPKFENFGWLKDPDGLKRWQTGRTGYPLIDAGMRELWATGYMHNRVRMVVGSFLVKNLLISWEEGARWFWDTLVDADLANNTLGWQWVGGCGADAAPYFRIFNPLTQSQKFDSAATYLKKWLPEFKHLDPADCHAPWIVKPMALELAQVELDDQSAQVDYAHQHAQQRTVDGADLESGRNAPHQKHIYPKPIVEHSYARQRALDVLAASK